MTCCEERRRVTPATDQPALLSALVLAVVAAVCTPLTQASAPDYYFEADSGDFPDPESGSGDVPAGSGTAEIPVLCGPDTTPCRVPLPAGDCWNQKISRSLFHPSIKRVTQQTGRDYWWLADYRAPYLLDSACNVYPFTDGNGNTDNLYIDYVTFDGNRFYAYTGYKYIQEFRYKNGAMVPEGFRITIPGFLSHTVMQMISHLGWHYVIVYDFHKSNKSELHIISPDGDISTLTHDRFLPEAYYGNMILDDEQGALYICGQGAQCLTDPAAGSGSGSDSGSGSGSGSGSDSDSGSGFGSGSANYSSPPPDEAGCPLKRYPLILKYRWVNGEYIPDPEFNNGKPLLKIPAGEPGIITYVFRSLLHNNILYVLLTGGREFDQYLVAIDKDSGRLIENFSTFHYHGLSSPDGIMQTVNDKLHLFFSPNEGVLMYRTDLMGNMMDQSLASMADEMNGLSEYSYIRGYEVQPENLTSLTSERVFAFGSQFPFPRPGGRAFWHELTFRPVKEPVETVPATAASIQPPQSARTGSPAPDLLPESPVSSTEIPMLNTMIMAWAFISSQLFGQ